jgi:hypothetical protein
MAESKYGKYVITNSKRPGPAPEWKKNRPTDPNQARLLVWLDNNVCPGSFYAEMVWILKKTPEGGGHPFHTHDVDEIVGFVGSDPNNPTDLGGEAFFWLGDEKQVITKTCLVFVPAGLQHCPVIFNRVDRPILHWSTIPAIEYKSWPQT